MTTLSEKAEDVIDEVITSAIRFGDTFQQEDYHVLKNNRKALEQYIATLEEKAARLEGLEK
jgi:transcription elongation GreA/GreB family factor